MAVVTAQRVLRVAMVHIVRMAQPVVRHVRRRTADGRRIQPVMFRHHIARVMNISLGQTSVHFVVRVSCVVRHPVQARIVQRLQYIQRCRPNRVR